LSQLEKLDEYIKKEKKDIDSWFTKANKLRNLQANKYDIKKSYESIIETTKWRSKLLPVRLTPAIEKILVEFAFYIEFRSFLFLWER
jgi:hypothetical protein